MHKVTSRNTLNDTSTIVKPSDSDTDNSNEKNSAQMNLMTDDWKRMMSPPTRYRLGSASIHLRPREAFQLLFVAFLLVTIVFMLFRTDKTSCHCPACSSNQIITESRVAPETQLKYPLTDPVAIDGGWKYRIGIITDLDHSSKVESLLWQSFFLQGHLLVFHNGSFAVQLDEKSSILRSSLAQGGRGMELSELVTYNGKLLTVDDRTGIVYRIKDNDVIPWLILADGNGDVSKGFKSEWATVKDNYLYIGGLGKEWTSSTGKVLNFNPQYVKRVSLDGSVDHQDWQRVYNMMKDTAGFPSPGYMIHEAAAWSDIHRKWYFLPRRASKESYDDKLDEMRATNKLVVCDEYFNSVEIVDNFGPESKTHGFSSFKFIPGLNDQYILALKSEEIDGRTASYILVLDLKGKVHLDEYLVGPYKYEGVEFL